MEKDYYKTLGVSKSASADEIKKAYRKLALEFHPDRNKTKEADKKFKEVTQAYEILSNPQKRKQYDQFGAQAFENGGPSAGGQGRQGPFGGGPFNYTYTTSDFDFGNFSDPFDIFEQFFGGASPFGRAKPAYSLNITFLEAIKGVEKKVNINGEQKIIKIPAGVDSESRIRFDDFDVVLNVSTSPQFQRQGYDIFSQEDITMVQAALGGVVEVETIDGKVKLKIPEGTQPGALIRIKEKGVVHLNSKGRGDQYVRIKIQIPKNLNAKQKEILKEFSSTKKGWF